MQSYIIDGNREERAMKTEKHGYKFTNKNNSRGGIIATVLGVIAIILLCIGIYISYANKGDAGIQVGMLGALSFIISGIGLINGLLSFKEKDRFYIFSFVGCGVSGIIWLITALIIGYGVMAL